jgi:hypothetical protein
VRDSFIDDRALDRTMRDKFPLMVLACRDMSPEAVRLYVVEMRPHIVREYRLRLVRLAYPLTADPGQRLGATLAGAAGL